MKKMLLTLAVIIFILFSPKAQYVTIPDDGLRNYFLQNYSGCMNGSNMLDTTCTAVVNETSVGLGMDGTGISNWSGFQYFKNLQSLQLWDADYPTLSSLPLPATLKSLFIAGANGATALPPLPAGLHSLYLDEDEDLTSLPALPASLDTLDCHASQLITALPQLPAAMTYLAFQNCNLTALPALPSQLKWLDCDYNHITTVPVLPAQLEYFSVTSNDLTSLPAFPPTLTTIYFTSNQVSVLPSIPNITRDLQFEGNLISSIPTLPDSLRVLNCSNNPIPVLPALPSKLTDLNCQVTPLTSLPALPATLTDLFCRFSQLTSLPNLPATLISLNCDGNHLTTLPALPASLEELHCEKNQLLYLPDFNNGLTILTCQGNPITCLPVIPQSLWQIEMGDTIGCIPNVWPNTELKVFSDETTSIVYNPDINPYPLCNPTNNIHHCTAFPLMDGYVYNDNNNNLVKDANEPYRANVKVRLSNGTFTNTNSNGYYQIATDTIGSHTLTCDPPNYFAAVPPQYVYNFTSYDSLITNNFALQATAVVDSLSISLTAIDAARPGFPLSYAIRYENDGTTTLSPSIVFNYDNSQLVYDSSSNAAVINNGTNIQLTEPGIVAGEHRSFIAYFRVNGASVGDTITVNATASAGTAIASDSTFSEVFGSYDPNDKSATPKLSTAEVAQGKYIYYHIRFQNTGNDTAFNVVLTDTLSGLLQSSTLQVINTSHPCKLTVKNNIAYFEFINILLPDSNVNKLKSHGFVTLRVQPQASVAVNTNIPNKAAIYFDYNSPVITNTAITEIVEPLIVVPLKLLSFTAVRQTKYTANINWSTTNEMNIRRFNIETSSDGRNFTGIASENAKGGQYNSYNKIIPVPADNIVYVRLEMIDIDGHFSYGPIIPLKAGESKAGFVFLNNPVKDVLSIALIDETLKNTTAGIINMQGVVVKKIQLQNDINKIDINNLSPGAYNVKTIKGSKSFVIIR